MTANLRLYMKLLNFFGTWWKVENLSFVPTINLSRSPSFKNLRKLLRANYYRYCLTLIDRFTRWPETTPIANIEPNIVADAFYRTWIARFGTPATVTTDRGTQFESAIFKSLTNLLGCNRIRTTASFFQLHNREMASLLESRYCMPR